VDVTVVVDFKEFNGMDFKEIGALVSDDSMSFEYLSFILWVE